MKLTVFNGSPRGKRSNTGILFDHFIQGYIETPGNSVAVHYIAQKHDTEKFLQEFVTIDAVFLGFPLYTDGMPGMVKEFIESLEPLCGRPENPAIGFLVQSGFIEGTHTSYIEKYLHKLASRLGSRYLGTIRKGGVEGIQEQPERSTHKLRQSLYVLGKEFGETGQLNMQIVQKLANPTKLPWWVIPILNLFRLFGLVDYSWNTRLKANGVYEQRWARPYQIIKKEGE
jgi:multimeric flavodoxin WrbA